MVELRLASVEDGGMPQDCFVSVRIGDTQKLSRLSASRVYRFPKAGDRRYGKIEVFRRIGACSVDVDPGNKDLREVNISCLEAGFGTLGLKVEVAGEKTVEAEPVEAKKEGSKVKAAKEYLSKHGLEVRLSEAMQAVLRERPADPAQFLAGKLVEARDNIGGIKLPPLNVGKQDNSGMDMPMKQAMSKTVEEPQKANARPQKLEPLQKAPAQAAAPKAASTAVVAPKTVLPFADFYKANFQFIGTEAFARCYSKFPRTVPKPAPAPVMGKLPPQLKPSVGTWLNRIPPSLNTKMQESTVAVAKTAAAAFKLKPSVGTWLAPCPPALDMEKVETKPPVESFKKLASVGTWLKPLPKALRQASAPVVSAVAKVSVKTDKKEGAGTGWVHKPSIGTWLAKPTPAICPVAQKPRFSKKPSVGTWLAPRLDATPEAAQAFMAATSSNDSVPMMMSTMARCGPAFPSMGLRPNVMMI